ncbi:MAG: hypothetical protein KUG76_07150 [Gammaproteobacteria bacterium]|nr:hypothetical protein [Gammaproteobacteria bacterium]
MSYSITAYKALAAHVAGFEGFEGFEGSVVLALLQLTTKGFQQPTTY